MREEFACKCGLCNKSAVDIELLNILELIRSKFNQPVIINSANRCEPYNKKIGGKKNSYHLHGMAADIKVKNTNPEDVFNFVINKFPDVYGLGLYYNSFVHIDVRQTKTRWKQDEKR